MKLGQLKKKVAKEFAKSPAKTVILIALCPVALYFVVPLFLRATPQAKEANRAQVIASNLAPSATPSANLSPGLAARPGPTWKQLNAWIDVDWRTQPGSIEEVKRNPFQSQAVKVDQAAADGDVPPKKSVARPALSREAFDAMGFQLTGTLVLRSYRSATINGKPYHEGAIVTPERYQQAADASEYGFLLKQVGVRHAVLERDGMQFRLKLKPAQAPDGVISVVRTTPASSD